MTITKAQKETLELMRDTGAFIRKWSMSTKYVLYRPSTGSGRSKSQDNDYGDKIKVIKYEWMRDLKPFFIQTYDRRYSNEVYTFRPDAEISDAWLTAENQKRIQASIDKREVEKAAILAEQQKATAWFELTGPYTVDFSGDHFGGSGSIYCNGEFITSFGLMHSSSGDQTFEAMMKRDKNLQHFLNIAEMLRRANRGEQ